MREVPDPCGATMRELISALAPWWTAGETAAVGTVVKTWRSAPRPAGAAMLVGPDSSVVGSISGGCVESAVYEDGLEVRSSGKPVLRRYGVSDGDAFANGLTCGGAIDVYVEPVDQRAFPDFDRLVEDVERGRPVATATALDGSGRRIVFGAPDDTDTVGTLGHHDLDHAVLEAGRGMLAQAVTGPLRVGTEGQRRHDDLEIFVQSFAPKPRMIVFGAVDFAAAVAQMGSFLGYHVVVCDARATFATRQRFPDADEIVVQWPHRYLQRTATDASTVVCVLTHDPKFDVPLLEVALRRELAYVGAMGSRRTAEHRRERLRAAGLTEAQLAVLRAPIGLDLGARTPAETAMSIAAEIVAARTQASSRHLGDLSGPIHR